MRWAGHVALIVEKRDACRFLVEKSGGRRTFGRIRRRWVDNIEMDLEVVWTGLIRLRIVASEGLL
jgi:hypothetical protein